MEKSPSIGDSEYFDSCLHELAVIENDIQQLNLSELLTQKTGLSSRIGHLTKEISDLAMNNYRTYADASRTAEHCKAMFSQVNDRVYTVKDSIPSLLEGIGKFSEHLKHFQGEYDNLSLVTDRENAIWSLLDMPMLMDRCVRLGEYESAFALTEFAVGLKTSKYYAHPMVRQPVDFVLEARHGLLDELFNKFSGPIDLPKCIHIVNNIRKIPYISNTQLRVSLLQYRDVYLDTKVNKILAQEDYIIKVIDVYRDCMYDTMILYLAVFPEVDVQSHRRTATTTTEHRWERWTGSSQTYLLQAWAHKNVEQLFDLVRGCAPQKVNFDILREKLMSFGSSFGRLGLDFRLLIMEELRAMEMRVLKEQISSALAKLLATGSITLVDPEIVEMARVGLNQSEEDVSIPVDIIAWDDLVTYSNEVISALNASRYTFAVNQINDLFDLLQSSFKQLLAWIDAQAESSDVVTAKRAARIVVEHFIPFMQTHFTTSFEVPFREKWKVVHSGDLEIPFKFDVNCAIYEPLPPPESGPPTFSIGVDVREPSEEHQPNQETAEMEVSQEHATTEGEVQQEQHLPVLEQGKPATAEKTEAPVSQPAAQPVVSQARVTKVQQKHAQQHPVKHDEGLFGGFTVPGATSFMQFGSQFGSQLQSLLHDDPLDDEEPLHRVKRDPESRTPETSDEVSLHRVPESQVKEAELSTGTAPPPSEVEADERPLHRVKRDDASESPLKPQTTVEESQVEYSEFSNAAEHTAQLPVEVPQLESADERPLLRVKRDAVSSESEVQQSELPSAAGGTAPLLFAVPPAETSAEPLPEPEVEAPLVNEAAPPPAEAAPAVPSETEVKLLSQNSAIEGEPQQPHLPVVESETPATIEKAEVPAPASQAKVTKVEQKRAQQPPPKKEEGLFGFTVPGATSFMHQFGSQFSSQLQSLLQDDPVDEEEPLHRVKRNDALPESPAKETELSTGTVPPSVEVPPPEAADERPLRRVKRGEPPESGLENAQVKESELSSDVVGAPPLPVVVPLPEAADEQPLHSGGQMDAASQESAVDDPVILPDDEKPLHRVKRDAMPTDSLPEPQEADLLNGLEPTAPSPVELPQPEPVEQQHPELLPAAEVLPPPIPAPQPRSEVETVVSNSFEYSTKSTTAEHVISVSVTQSAVLRVEAPPQELPAESEVLQPETPASPVASEPVPSAASNTAPQARELRFQDYNAPLSTSESIFTALSKSIKTALEEDMKIPSSQSLLSSLSNTVRNVFEDDEVPSEGSDAVQPEAPDLSATKEPTSEATTDSDSILGLFRTMRADFSSGSASNSQRTPSNLAETPNNHAASPLEEFHTMMDTFSERSTGAVPAMASASNTTVTSDGDYHTAPTDSVYSYSLAGSESAPTTDDTHTPPSEDPSTQYSMSQSEGAYSVPSTESFGGFSDDLLSYTTATPSEGVLAPPPSEDISARSSPPPSTLAATPVPPAEIQNALSSIQAGFRGDAEDREEEDLSTVNLMSSEGTHTQGADQGEVEDATDDGWNDAWEEDDDEDEEGEESSVQVKQKKDDPKNK